MSAALARLDATPTVLHCGDASNCASSTLASQRRSIPFHLVELRPGNDLAIGLSPTREQVAHPSRAAPVGRSGRHSADRVAVRRDCVQAASAVAEIWPVAFAPPRQSFTVSRAWITRRSQHCIRRGPCVDRHRDPHQFMDWTRARTPNNACVAAPAAPAGADPVHTDRRGVRQSRLLP